MSDVTVVVATFGSRQWAAWGDQAAESVEAGVEVLRVHQNLGRLAQARNEGLRQVRTERVCFLDADDSLEPGYFDRPYDADVLVTPLDGAFPVVRAHTHACVPACLPKGNYIHVGAIASTGLIQRLGGFRDHPIYEDWDLWLRCHYAGASFARSPGPSYLSKQRGTGGRNEAFNATIRRNIRTHILRTAMYTPNRSTR